MDAERLRTRLMIAAQRFATEIADAVVEAAGAPEAVAEEPPRRRRGVRPPPVVSGEVDPAASVKADAALAKLGIRRAG